MQGLSSFCQLKVQQIEKTNKITILKAKSPKDRTQTLAFQRKDRPILPQTKCTQPTPNYQQKRSTNFLERERAKERGRDKKIKHKNVQSLENPIALQNEYHEILSGMVCHCFLHTHFMSASVSGCLCLYCEFQGFAIIIVIC